MRYLINKDNDILLGSLIGLVRAIDGNEHLVSENTNKLIIEGLLNIKNKDINDLINKIEEEKKNLIPSCYECLAKCGRTDNFNVENLLNNDEKTIDNIRLYIENLSELAKNYSDINEIYKKLFYIGLDNFINDYLENWE